MYKNTVAPHHGQETVERNLCFPSGYKSKNAWKLTAITHLRNDSNLSNRCQAQALVWGVSLKAYDCVSCITRYVGVCDFPLSAIFNGCSGVRHAFPWRVRMKTSRKLSRDFPLSDTPYHCIHSWRKKTYKKHSVGYQNCGTSPYRDQTVVCLGLYECVVPL